MTATLLGAVATAAALGVTHALEPDHVAGISTLTSRYGDSRRSALVGVCFSLGHVALVVAWLVVAYLLLGRTTFPAVLDTAGTLVVAAVLGGIGVVLTVRGYRAAARAHAGRHHGRDDATADGNDAGDETPGDPHVHLPLVGHDHDHDHTTGAYLRTGLVGALFTLSPPLSMIAFSATLLSVHGPGSVVLAVLAYTTGIVATMGTIGAGVGVAFRLAERHRRAFGVARVITGVGVVALAGSLALGALPAL